MAAHGGVREMSVTLALSSSAVCLSASFFTKHLSPACSTFTLFLDERWYTPPPSSHTHCSAASQWFSLLSLLTACSLCQCMLPCALLSSHSTGRHTQLLLLSYFLLLQLSWRAKLLLVKPQGGEREAIEWVTEEGWKELLSSWSVFSKYHLQSVKVQLPEIISWHVLIVCLKKNLKVLHCQSTGELYLLIIRKPCQRGFARTL